ncbi:alpha/beta hydrolase [Croceitalea vernalis]|uniref:Alpha/beta hydrolase n=1 Tax=Croceitalea vernalis TaxID=3075599 RepID=A0ABU3BJ74_9FLAO|nr:alpha/beta hydrolase [Croceitalea sp. P007]MDT0622203.1 alpha/beta hydrolase [Croceitalea sp. P007]
MIKKYLPFFIFFILVQLSNSQELRLQKGLIMDSIAVKDSVNHTFALYLPERFEMKGSWPVLFVFDMNGKSKQSMAMFKNAAEANGYILASPNMVNDSLTVSQNILNADMVIRQVKSLFPVNNNRIYTAGYSSGARFANLAPIVIKDIKGVLSIGASLVNTELLLTKNPFHFVAISGTEDFNYTSLIEDEKVLNRLKFPNNLLFFDGGTEWPNPTYIEKALSLFDLSAMAKGNIPKDSLFIAQNYKKELKDIEVLQSTKNLLLTERLIKETITSYRTLIPIDSLKNVQKSLKKDKLYRSLNRIQNAVLFKENLLREDFAYYLEEDILTYNYNNLGWWNYQMTQINGFISGDSKLEQQMGKRLLGYVNALVEDNIDLVQAEPIADDEALILLLMLKTITEPDQIDNYIKVISIASKNSDYGTALYYLEELLKKGFKNKNQLYNIEHTTLFKITPEFNKLIEKYLNNARYEIKDE